MKRTWIEVGKKDLKYNLFEDLAHDKSEWRNIIHVADPNIVGTTGHGFGDEDCECGIPLA